MRKAEKMLKNSTKGIVKKLQKGRKTSLNYAKGSYTVEAAFIVPIILGLIFVLMYTTFLLHDRVVLQSNLHEVMYLLLEEQMVCEEKEYQDELRQMLWVVEIEKADISESILAFSGEVKAKAKMDIPVLSIFIEPMQQIELSATCSKLQPEIIKWKRG